jgi:hypothetical protein
VSEPHINGSGERVVGTSAAMAANPGIAANGLAESHFKN